MTKQKKISKEIKYIYIKKQQNNDNEKNAR